MRFREPVQNIRYVTVLYDAFDRTTLSLGHLNGGPDNSLMRKVQLFFAARVALFIFFSSLKAEG